MGRSRLLFYLKEEIEKRYIMELKIHEVLEDQRYSEGVKYSMVFIEPRTGKRVLMDNHHPKGPHYHLDKEEFPARYQNEDVLIAEFKKLVFQHFGVKL